MQDPVDVPIDQFVDVDGIRFHHLDWGGDGEPLLLLAGLGCTAHVFAELAPSLNDRFRVLALTRRGHGATGRGRAGHTMADGAEDARRFLDAMGIERAHVAGHSMGGGEVSALAARHPARVARIVYVDGAYDWADNPTLAWAEEESGPTGSPRTTTTSPSSGPCSPTTSAVRRWTRCCAPPWTYGRTGRWSTGTPSRPWHRLSPP